LGGLLNRIVVIGVGSGPIRASARSLLDDAELVAGGRRHLLGHGVAPERAVVLRGDLSEALERMEEADGMVAVLASGDPGFFGIVRLLAARFGNENLHVLPAVSPISETFAWAGLPWDDAVVVSAHGRAPHRAVNVCRAYPKVAVLTSPNFGPVKLAEALNGLDRTFIVAERLGNPDERFFEGDAAAVTSEEWDDPNLVVVYDQARAVGGKAWISARPDAGRGPWALPEVEFEHRSGMITKAEIRAFVLARLGPGPGDVVWDVGAGSGSVAVECARFGAAAIAVEKDPESCARVRQNAARHGAYVRIVEGAAPDALRDLPEPDAVFVGGTGANFEEIVKLAAVRAHRCVVLTLITLERVVPVGEILESCGLEVETTLLQASRMKGAGTLHRLAPETPVFVVSGYRPGTRSERL
jgi:precorrin-6B C5,15-methyltransferase / cobalt-precorrin-6B C5,C15-methyltransferase